MQRGVWHMCVVGCSRRDIFIVLLLLLLLLLLPVLLLENYRVVACRWLDLSAWSMLLL